MDKYVLSNCPSLYVIYHYIYIYVFYICKLCKPHCSVVPSGAPIQALWEVWTCHQRMTIAWFSSGMRSMMLHGKSTKGPKLRTHSWLVHSTHPKAIRKAKLLRRCTFASRDRPTWRPAKGWNKGLDRGKSTIETVQAILYITLICCLYSKNNPSLEVETCRCNQSWLTWLLHILTFKNHSVMWIRSWGPG